jgi:tetratricopeptide (TPR) repeat protein
MLGDMMERATYDTPAALRYYLTSLDIKRDLINEDAANPKYLSALSLSYERVGNIQMKTGNFSAAYDMLSEATKSASDYWRMIRKTAISVEDCVCRITISAICCSLTANTSRLWKVTRKVENSPNREFGRRLRRRRPTDARLFRRFDEQSISALGDSAKAFELAARSLALREKLFIAEPANIQVYGDFTVSLDTVGEIEAEAGRVGDGLAKLRRSLEMREAALRQDPSMTIARRFAAISRNKIGKVLLREKNTEKALAEFRQALDINLDLYNKDKTNLDLNRELSESYANTAAALTALAQIAAGKNESANLRAQAGSMNQSALNILLQMKEKKTFFGSDERRLEQLSRETAQTK